MPLYWQVITAMAFAASLGALSTAWFARMTARDAIHAADHVVESHLELLESLMRASSAEGDGTGPNVVPIRRDEKEGETE